MYELIVVSLFSLAGLIFFTFISWYLAKKFEERTKELQESEEKYRNLVERANDGIAIIQDGVIVYANKKLAEMWGGSVEELLNTPFVNYIHPDEVPKLVDRYKRRLASEDVESVYETTLLRKDGSEIYVSVSAGLINYQGKTANLVIIRDLTERKKIEEALKRSEERYRDLWENANDIFYIHDLEGNFLDVNKTGREAFGYVAEDITKLNIRDVVDENYLPKAVENIQKKILYGKPTEPYELLCYSKDGKPIWVEIRSRPIIENGKVVAVQGVARDITERKRLEEKLRESEEKFRVLAEKSLVGIYIIQDGVLVYANSKFAEIFGYSLDEVIGRDAIFLVHSEDRKIIEDIMRRIIEEVESIHHIFRVTTKKGEIKMVEFFGSRAVIGGKPAIIGTLVDITEIMRLNRLLKVLNSINKLIVHERNKKSLLEKACKELSNLEGYSAVTICLVEDKKITPVSSSGNSDVLEVHKNCTLINEVAKCKISVTRSLDECRNCPLYEEMKDNSKWVLSTPMFADGEVKGILTIYFVSDITKEEEELLRTMANDLAFAMRAIELDELKRKAYEQIEHNIEQYAILIDHIRNPLAAIIGIAEMEMKNETAAKIIEQARRIEEVLVRLDKGWLKSEQIRKFLREYP